MAMKDTEMDDVLFITAAAHVVGRAGLASAGAMCGTFVAAEFARADAAWFDTAPFIAAMVLAGLAGFYLGIDIPRPTALSVAIARPRLDTVQLLSSTGTFLAAVAGLISVYSFVFDEPLLGAFAYMVGSWWIFGVAMQIIAGLTGRLCVSAQVTR
jgi:hypothetical protein